MKKLISLLSIISSLNISFLTVNFATSCSKSYKNDLSKIDLSNFDSLRKVGMQIVFVKMGIFFKINQIFYKSKISSDDLSISIKKYNIKSKLDTLELNDLITISGTKTNIIKGSIELKVVQ